ncbi:MAG: T9SS type A sorting domain-containing protein, partial [Bacteroidales bacterium]|nr:T9SS type A sorting domain-containing protein [Bacteroidales bacterium]
AYNPVYKSGYGPVNIKVIDPLNVSAATYSIKFDTTFLHYTFSNVYGAEEVLPGGDTAGVKYVSKWYLKNEETGKKYVSEVGTNVNFEQLFVDLGISVSFGPLYYPGLYQIGKKISVGPDGTDTLAVKNVVAPNNGVLESSIEFADSTRQWLRGVQDFDVPGNSINWIRSGTSFNQTSDDDYLTQDEAYDPEEAFEKLVDGTIAPYIMCSERSQDPNEAGPVFNNISKSKSSKLKYVASVDLVLTPDKTKWTRSPVIEMCPEPILAERGAKMFQLRKSASVDKDGNPSGWPSENGSSQNDSDPNYIMSHGMGWFPGYAVNLETGERMNIMFGEDSYLAGENGRDMIFNPSPNYFAQPSNAVLFGGKHYIYIMGSKEIDDFHFGSGTAIKYSFPAYDAGFSLAYSIDTIPPALQDAFLAYIYTSAMYVSIPRSRAGQEWLSNDAKIRIRVAKPLDRYYSTPLDNEDSENNHFPMYRFSTDNLATSQFDQEKAESDLDKIAVVPNPYYAFAVGSGYESVPLENLVKIINLPENCVVSIYNVSGTLIRKYTKDAPVTFIDWDLKNHAGIPIAGGVYIVHVKDQTTGNERIVKWFGSLRVEDFKEF